MTPHLCGPALGSGRRRKGGWWCLTFLTAWLLAGVAGSVSAQQALPTVTLSAGLYVIEAEVASTPAHTQRGLMFRESLGPRHGMLFVFDQQTQHCMWMVNTLIPLSVAFLRDDGTITNIEHMTPQTRTSHCADEPVSLALEMAQGWFEERGIEAGDRIRGLPQVTP